MKFFETNREWDNYVGRYVDVTKLTKAGRVAAWTAATLFFVAATFGVFADSGVDLLGDKQKTTLSDGEAKSVAEARYQRTFDSASPAGKFALQYLVPSEIVVAPVTGGSGVLGAFTDKDRLLFLKKDGCLSNTSYDINGGNIDATIRGIFSSTVIEGDIPTAAAGAYVDSDEPDVLVINSGHAESRDLRFEGLKLGDELMPADTQTRSVLDTYGCSTGIQGEPEAVIRGTGSSSWIG